MIVWDENNKVIANGTFMMTDIFRAYNHIPPLRPKLMHRLRKELNISRFNFYPFETYYATKIFIYFLKQVIRDVAFNNVRYIHNSYKQILLKPITDKILVRAACKELDALPTMPLFQVSLRFRAKTHFRYKKVKLYNDLLEEFKTQIRNGDMTGGISQDKYLEDYYQYVMDAYPTVPKKIIKAIMKDGLTNLFFPVTKRRGEIIVQEFDPSSKRVCTIMNWDGYTKNSSLYCAFMNYTKCKNDKHYYLILSDEDHEKVQKKVKIINGLVVQSFMMVQWMVKGRKEFKHIYRLKKVKSGLYDRLIFKTDVKTSNLEYIFRRFHSRYEPISNAK